MVDPQALVELIMQLINSSQNTQLIGTDLLGNKIINDYGQGSIVGNLLLQSRNKTIGNAGYMASEADKAQLTNTLTKLMLNARGTMGPVPPEVVRQIQAQAANIAPALPVIASTMQAMGMDTNAIDYVIRKLYGSKGSVQHLYGASVSSLTNFAGITGAIDIASTLVGGQYGEFYNPNRMSNISASDLADTIQFMSRSGQLHKGRFKYGSGFGLSGMGNLARNLGRKEVDELERNEAFKDLWDAEAIRMAGAKYAAEVRSMGGNKEFNANLTLDERRAFIFEDIVNKQLNDIKQYTKVDINFNKDAVNLEEALSDLNKQFADHISEAKKKGDTRKQKALERYKGELLQLTEEFYEKKNLRDRRGNVVSVRELLRTRTGREAEIGAVMVEREVEEMQKTMAEIEQHRSEALRIPNYTERRAALADIDVREAEFKARAQSTALGRAAYSVLDTTDVMSDAVNTARMAGALSSGYAMEGRHITQAQALAATKAIAGGTLAGVDTRRLAREIGVAVSSYKQSGGSMDAFVQHGINTQDFAKQVGISRFAATAIANTTAASRSFFRNSGMTEEEADAQVEKDARELTMFRALEPVQMLALARAGAKTMNQPQFNAMIADMPREQQVLWRKIRAGNFGPAGRLTPRDWYDLDLLLRPGLQRMYVDELGQFNKDTWADVLLNKSLQAQSDQDPWFVSAVEQRALLDQVARSEPTLERVFRHAIPMGSTAMQKAQDIIFDNAVDIANYLSSVSDADAYKGKNEEERRQIRLNKTQEFGTRLQRQFIAAGLDSVADRIGNLLAVAKDHTDENGNAVKGDVLPFFTFLSQLDTARAYAFSTPQEAVARYAIKNNKDAEAEVKRYIDFLKATSEKYREMLTNVETEEFKTANNDPLDRQKALLALINTLAGGESVELNSAGKAMVVDSLVLDRAIPAHYTDSYGEHSIPVQLLEAARFMIPVAKGDQWNRMDENTAKGIYTAFEHPITHEPLTVFQARGLLQEVQDYTLRYLKLTSSHGMTPGHPLNPEDRYNPPFAAFAENEFLTDYDAARAQNAPNLTRRVRELTGKRVVNGREVNDPDFGKDASPTDEYRAVIRKTGAVNATYRRMLEERMSRLSKYNVEPDYMVTGTTNNVVEYTDMNGNTVRRFSTIDIPRIWNPRDKEGHRLYSEVETAMSNLVQAYYNGDERAAALAERIYSDKLAAYKNYYTTHVKSSTPDTDNRKFTDAGSVRQLRGLAQYGRTQDELRRLDTKSDTDDNFAELGASFNIYLGDASLTRLINDLNANGGAAGSKPIGDIYMYQVDAENRSFELAAHGFNTKGERFPTDVMSFDALVSVPEFKDALEEYIRWGRQEYARITGKSEAERTDEEKQFLIEWDKNEELFKAANEKKAAREYNTPEQIAIDSGMADIVTLAPTSGLFLTASGNISKFSRAHRGDNPLYTQFVLANVNNSRVNWDRSAPADKRTADAYRQYTTGKTSSGRRIEYADFLKELGILQRLNGMTPAQLERNIPVNDRFWGPLAAQFHARTFEELKGRYNFYMENAWKYDDTEKQWHRRTDEIGNVGFDTGQAMFLSLVARRNEIAEQHGDTTEYDERIFAYLKKLSERNKYYAEEAKPFQLRSAARREEAYAEQYESIATGEALTAPDPRNPGTVISREVAAQRAVAARASAKRLTEEAAAVEARLKKQYEDDEMLLKEAELEGKTELTPDTSEHGRITNRLREIEDRQSEITAAQRKLEADALAAGDTTDKYKESKEYIQLQQEYDALDYEATVLAELDASLDQLENNPDYAEYRGITRESILANLHDKLNKARVDAKAKAKEAAKAKLDKARASRDKKVRELETSYNAKVRELEVAESEEASQAALVKKYDDRLKFYSWATDDSYRIPDPDSVGTSKYITVGELKRRLAAAEAARQKAHNDSAHINEELAVLYNNIQELKQPLTKAEEEYEATVRAIDAIPVEKVETARTKAIESQIRILEDPTYSATLSPQDVAYNEKLRKDREAVAAWRKAKAEEAARIAGEGYQPTEANAKILAAKYKIDLAEIQSTGKGLFKLTDYIGNIYTVDDKGVIRDITGHVLTEPVDGSEFEVPVPASTVVAPLPTEPMPATTPRATEEPAAMAVPEEVTEEAAAPVPATTTVAEPTPEEVIADAGKKYGIDFGSEYTLESDGYTVSVGSDKYRIEKSGSVRKWDDTRGGYVPLSPVTTSETTIAVTEDVDSSTPTTEPRTTITTTTTTTDVAAAPATPAVSVPEETPESITLPSGLTPAEAAGLTGTSPAGAPENPATTVPVEGELTPDAVAAMTGRSPADVPREAPAESPVPAGRDMSTLGLSGYTPEADSKLLEQYTSTPTSGAISGKGWVLAMLKQRATGVSPMTGAPTEALTEEQLNKKIPGFTVEDNGERREGTVRDVLAFRDRRLAGLRLFINKRKRAGVSLDDADTQMLLNDLFYSEIANLNTMLVSAGVPVLAGTDTTAQELDYITTVATPELTTAAAPAVEEDMPFPDVSLPDVAVETPVDSAETSGPSAMSTFMTNTGYNLDILNSGDKDSWALYMANRSLREAEGREAVTLDEETLNKKLPGTEMTVRDALIIRNEAAQYLAVKAKQRYKVKKEAKPLSDTSIYNRPKMFKIQEINRKLRSLGIDINAELPDYDTATPAPVEEGTPATETEPTEAVATAPATEETETPAETSEVRTAELNPSLGLLPSTGEVSYSPTAGVYSSKSGRPELLTDYTGAPASERLLRAARSAASTGVKRTEPSYTASRTVEPSSVSKDKDLLKSMADDISKIKLILIDTTAKL